MLRFAANALSNYSRMLLAIAATVVITPKLITSLGADAFGVWALVNAATGVFMLLDLGMGNAAIRSAAGTDTAARNQLVSTLWTVSLIVVAVAMGVLLLARPWIPRFVGLEGANAGTALWVFFLVASRYVVMGQGLGIFRQILFGSNRLTELNLIQGSTLLMQTVAIWIGLSHGVGLVGVAAIGLGAGALEHLGYVIYAYRHVPDLRVSPRLASLDAWRSARSLCVASFFMGLSGLVLLKTDPILVRVFLLLSQVAIYAIALKVAENVLLLIKQVANALTPMIVQIAVAGDDARLRELLLTSTKYLLLPAGLAAAGAGALGSDAIRLWVGAEFAAAGPIMTVLLIAMAITAACLPAASILTQSGLHGAAGRASLTGAVINVVASALLARQFGVFGIAGGTLVAAILVDAGIVIRTANRRFDIGITEYTFRVIVPVIVPIALLWISATAFSAFVAPPHSFVALALNAVVSSVVALASFGLTGITREERRLVRQRLIAPLVDRFTGRLGQPVES